MAIMVVRVGSDGPVSVCGGNYVCKRFLMAAQVFLSDPTLMLKVMLM